MVGEGEAWEAVYVAEHAVGRGHFVRELLAALAPRPVDVNVVPGDGEIDVSSCWWRTWSSPSPQEFLDEIQTPWAW